MQIDVTLLCRKVRRLFTWLPSWLLRMSIMSWKTATSCDYYLSSAVTLIYPPNWYSFVVWYCNHFQFAISPHPEAELHTLAGYIQLFILYQICSCLALVFTCWGTAVLDCKTCTPIIWEGCGPVGNGSKNSQQTAYCRFLFVCLFVCRQQHMQHRCTLCPKKSVPSTDGNELCQNLTDSHNAFTKKFFWWDILCPFCLQSYISFQRWKNFKNQLRFVKLSPSVGSPHFWDTVYIAHNKMAGQQGSVNCTDICPRD